MIKEKDDTGRAILAAAKTEFAEKGFSGARMSCIAEKASANQALIHYYFGSKENLYNEVLSSLFGPEKFCQDKDASAPQWDLSLPQKLYCIIYFMTKIQLRTYDPEAHRIFHWELAEGQKFLRPFVEKVLEPRMSALIKIIDQGVKNGDFSTPNPFLTISTLFVLSNALQKNQKMFIGTRLEPYLPDSYDAGVLVDHMLSTIFKMLAPEGKPFVIPTVPAEVTAFLDEIIEQIAQDKESEFDCKILSRFLSLLQLQF